MISCFCRTCLAVAGSDYCIVAASNRLSSGFSILTRDESKIIKLYVALCSVRCGFAVLLCVSMQVGLVPGAAVQVLSSAAQQAPWWWGRSQKCVVATANFQADRKQLQKTLQHRHIMYQHNHHKPMSVAAAARLVSNTLYYKRFFPYYTYNLVCGLDEEGKLPAHIKDQCLQDTTIGL